MAESVKSSDGRAVRWQAHRAARRAEFVDAAVRAIEEHGPDVRTEQIAAAAGVPRPRLYRYFDGKADLDRAVVERATELFSAELQPLWRPAGSPREVLDTVIRAWLRWVAEHADLYRYVRRADAAGQPRQAGQPRPYAEIKRAITAHAAAVVRAYAEIFQVRLPVVEPLTAGLFGMVESATNQWLEGVRDLGPDALAEELVGWAVAVITDLARRHEITLDWDRPLPPIQPTD